MNAITTTQPEPATATPESAPPVVREAEYPQPPDRVWGALTDPDALAEWLLPAPDFAPEPGRRFRFEPDGTEAGLDAAVECEVTEAEPPGRLAYTWRATPGRPAGRVTWTLTPTERGGTRLRIVHEPTVAASVEVVPVARPLSGPVACSFAVAPARRYGTHSRRRYTRLTSVLVTEGNRHP